MKRPALPAWAAGGLRRFNRFSRLDRDSWLLGGAALALAACLFKPTLPWSKPLPELMVVLDITQSMNTPDQWLDGRPAPRLQAAKQRLREALSLLPCGSRVGWALYTEYRSFLLFTPVEVCAHLDELRDSLAHIDNRMAWIGASEVAKGLYSGLRIASQLPRPAALVFLTDGHESPPLSPRHRPRFDLEPGQVPGLIVGVGGTLPLPIPKFDPSGQPLGAWSADDVLQVDPRSLGRGGSVGGEQLVETEPGDGAVQPPALGATPGNEHLSSLREPYLRLLAAETGLQYHRLDDAAGLAAALQAPALTQPVPVRADARVPLALLALGLLLARLWPGRGALRQGFRWKRALPRWW
jgi:mxaL protein